MVSRMVLETRHEHCWRRIVNLKELGENRFVRNVIMRKFQVTIRFDMNEEFAALVPPHRTYINRLIEQGIIDHYVVTMETQRVWITFSAENKKDVERYLAKSPLFKYWTYEIDELFMVDGLHYRLPVVQLN
jgi:muconolactone delta-isomerase